MTNITITMANFVIAVVAGVVANILCDCFKSDAK